MRKRGSGETPSVRTFIGRVYKVMAITSEVMARLSGVRKESRKVVVLKRGIVKETGIR